MKPGFVLRLVASVPLFLLAFLSAREESRWVNGLPLIRALPSIAGSALPPLLLAVALLVRNRLSPRVAMVTGWAFGIAALAGAVTGGGIEEGRPLRSMSVLWAGLAAVTLLSRPGAGHGLARLLSIVAAAFFLLVGLVLLTVWSDSCGDEVLFGGCSEPAFLAEERLSASLDTAEEFRLMYRGRTGATGGGPAQAIYVGPPRPLTREEFGIPASFQPYASGAVIVDDGPYEPLGEWAGPSPKPHGRCVITVYVFEDVDSDQAFLYGISDEDVERIAQGSLVLIDTTVRCID